jgi:hypothetical protein
MTISTCSYAAVPRVTGVDLKEHVKGDVMCVLMDPPLLLPGEKPHPGKITVKDLVRA